MVDTVSDIHVIQSDFQAMHIVLLSVMDRLSGIAHPVASAAVQDLSNLTNSLQLLQSKVSEHLHTGHRQLNALVGVGHVINSSRGLESQQRFCRFRKQARVCHFGFLR